MAYNHVIPNTIGDYYVTCHFIMANSQLREDPDLQVIGFTLKAQQLSQRRLRPHYQLS